VLDFTKLGFTGGGVAFTGGVAKWVR